MMTEADSLAKALGSNGHRDFTPPPEEPGKWLEGKDEVVALQEPHEGFYGLQSVGQLNDAVLRHVDEHGKGVIAYVGLPDSGKSTITLQQLQKYVKWLDPINAKRGRNTRVAYMGWGPYVLSLTGDPRQFGHISAEQLAEYSEGFKGEIQRLVEEHDVLAVVEAPGIVGRGESTVRDLVVENGAFVHGVYADEAMRKDKILFRERLHNLKPDSPSDITELGRLLTMHGIDPNHEVDAELLVKMQRGGATRDGIKAVDKDFRREAVHLIVDERIKVPSIPHVERYTEEMWHALLEHSVGAEGTQIVGNFMALHMEDSLRVPADRAFLGRNPNFDGTKNLLQPVLDAHTVKYNKGRIIYLPPPTAVFATGRQPHGLMF